MSSVGEIIATVLWLYFVVLLARFVIDLIQMLSRTWQPSGFMLVVAEFVFTLTDPPLKLLRRLIPPLKIGSITLDLSFIVLIIALQIAIQLALSI
ncbi:MAG: YggT family protein [Candidatus Nanopelagicales bacterium]|nr:YggT family protein [Candidatus Nanopelagicales bacterium]